LYWKYLLKLRAGYDGTIDFNRLFVLWKNPQQSDLKYIAMTYPGQCVDSQVPQKDCTESKAQDYTDLNKQ
jgi:hypothetical protein